MSSRMEWNSGVVAGGAIIDSPIFDTREMPNGIYVIIDNSAGAVTRNLTMDTFLSDGVTNVDSGFVLRTVAIGAKERGVIGPWSSALGTPALLFAFPIVLPTKVRFHLLQNGGVQNGQLVIFGN